MDPPQGVYPERGGAYHDQDMHDGIGSRSDKRNAEHSHQQVEVFILADVHLEHQTEHQQTKSEGGDVTHRVVILRLRRLLHDTLQHHKRFRKTPSLHFAILLTIVHFNYTTLQIYCQYRRGTFHTMLIKFIILYKIRTGAMHSRHSAPSPPQCTHITKTKAASEQMHTKHVRLWGMPSV